MTLSPSLRVRRGSSSALRTRLDGNEPGCHVRTRTGARGSKSRPRSSPTTSLRAVTGPRSSFPAHRPRLPQRDPQACRSYSLLYSRNESGGETRIGPLTNREVFVTESELGRAALSLASFFVAKHFTPSPLHSHPPQWTLPRPACAMPAPVRARCYTATQYRDASSQCPGSSERGPRTMQPAELALRAIWDP